MDASACWLQHGPRIMLLHLPADLPALVLLVDLELRGVAVGRLVQLKQNEATRSRVLT